MTLPNEAGRCLGRVVSATWWPERFAFGEEKALMVDATMTPNAVDD
jgi:hypothetical protein